MYNNDSNSSGDTMKLFKKLLVIVAVILIAVLAIKATIDLFSDIYDILKDDESDIGLPSNISGSYFPPSKTTSYEWEECFFKLDKNSQDIQCIAILKNTGTTDIHLSSASFDVEDNNGNLVDVIDYVNISHSRIAPGEKSICYAVASLDHNNKAEEYKIIPNIRVEESNVKMIRYEVLDVVLSEDASGRVTIAGRVKNNTDEPGNIVYANIILYDNDKKPIGMAVETFIEGIEPGEQVSFKTTFGNWFNLEDVESYEIVSYPFQW